MAENTGFHKERLKEITESIEQGIRDLFQSNKYLTYLHTMSRFHRYSVNNTILIAMQRPDATLVAGFNKWRDQFGRNVLRGEKSIKIIAPTPFKKRIEQEKLDPLTRTPMLDKDGKVVTEEVEIKIPMYKVVSVFDVSQTEGKPLPQLASNLTGDVKQYEVFLEALRRSSPVPISIEAMTAKMDGYFDLEHQDIAIRRGMSEVQTVSAVIHEIAHAKLHNREQAQLAAAPGDESAPPTELKDRRTEEVEAESISYAVCAYYGIATGQNSFGYIASWSKDKELSELRASLETINKTASGLIDDIDRHFAAIIKERGIEQSEKEQAVPVPVASELEPEEPAPESKAPAHAAEHGEHSRVSEVLEPPATDDYPMPDPTLTVAARNAYGYNDDGIVPISHDRAIKLFQDDITVYLLYEDNSESMAFDRDDIDGHIGMFGVNREEWEKSQEYLSLIEGREVTQKELESNFLNNPADAFAIYQLKRTEGTRDLRFEALERLQAVGLTIERDNYDLIYTDRLANTGDTTEKLNAIWERFNINHPADFRGHSLSVSDIIALKQNGAVSFHYVDSTGIAEITTFPHPENYLKNVEMAMEDDYGMIDGIINNGKHPSVAELEAQVNAGSQISVSVLAHAVHAERSDGRPSVLEQLRTSPAKQEHHKAAPTRGAEMER